MLVDDNVSVSDFRHDDSDQGSRTAICGTVNYGPSAPPSHLWQGAIMSSRIHRRVRYLPMRGRAAENCDWLRSASSDAGLSVGSL
nr:hypothetical protein CFP56_20565 [Quercus suber]